MGRIGALAGLCSEDPSLRLQTYEWLSPCSYGFIDPSECTGPSPPAGLINAASNNWVALRVVNATDDFVYAEVRQQRGQRWEAL